MRWIGRLAAAIVLSGTVAGCEDSTGTEVPLFLVTDTVEVFAPIAGNAGLPTAVDITGNQSGGVVGGRFPELSRDALQWDFAVRIRDGELVLVPAAVVGIPNSRAGVTRALEGETFESVREAPPQVTFLTDTVIVMETGSVYAARSRDVPTTFGGACTYYAKLQPLEVDVATGALRFQIVSNQCGDPRLVAPD